MGTHRRLILAATALLALPGSAALAQGVSPRLPYRPFIDPLPLHDWWWVFLVPLAVGIAVVYKAVQMKDSAGYPRAVAVMALQIVLGMVALGAASYLLVAVYVRFIAEWLAG